MSTSSMADEAEQAGRSSEAGFTLVEALVALVVAGMVLAVFGRAMAGAWGSVKTPMDVVSGIVLARSAALGAPAKAFDGAAGRGFTIDRSSEPIRVDHKVSRLAPALVDRAKDTPKEPKATPASMQLAEPTGIVQNAPGAAALELTHVRVSVRTPMGRTLRFDTIRLDHAAP